MKKKVLAMIMAGILAAGGLLAGCGGKDDGKQSTGAGAQGQGAEKTESGYAMERRGSGLRKIISETEKLPGYEEYLKPEFFSTPSDFRVILKNVNYIMSGISTHETIHETIHDLALTQKQVLLLDFCIEARSRDEMQSFVGIINRSHFSKAYLKPLLASGKLRMTIPDKPKSRNQKYITAKGQ